MSEPIWAALAKATAKMPNPKFDSTNPHFKNKFASLKACDAAVKPHLAEAGLAYRQTAEGAELVTYVYGDGEQEVSRVPLCIVSDPQKQGSALTYARRYGLCAAFGLVGEDDDDGEQAAKGAQEAPKASQKPKTASDALEDMREAFKAYRDSHGLSNDEVTARLTEAVGEVAADSPVPRLKQAAEWLRANG